MCGIAGIIRWAAPAAPTEIEAMTAALAHRGPDGSGIHIDGGVALGHRRLSIIDLECGRQPMTLDNEQLWITYNGELYNFKQLRQELEQFGHRFRTHSDTEVILHAYKQWGADALNRFRGMFAFAIADHTAREVFIARDQFGIKPLYYRVEAESVSFASELPALTHVVGPPLRGRLEGIESYLRYRYVRGPETIYRNVWQLPPGHFMRIGFDGQVVPPKRYWQFQFQQPAQKSNTEWVDQFEACLDDSVSAHLVADVPFGVFLSGGIDSTLVASRMAKLLGRQVTAFSIGFGEAEFSELRYAEQAAETLGINLVTKIVKPDITSLLPTIVAHYGQPYADTSMIPTWYLCQLARSQVPMVLSGDGGDELFAGYDRYFYFAKDGIIHELKRLLCDPRQFAFRATRLWQSLTTPSLAWVNQYEDYLRFVTREFRFQLWKPEYRSLIAQTQLNVCRTSLAAQASDRVSFAQATDIETYLPDDILTKVDIAAMAHGLEVRPPLVDIRIAALAADLAYAAKIGQSATGSPILKSTPKHLLQKTFKPDFVHRKKMGFSIPEAQWLQKGSPVRHLLDDLISTKQSAASEWFDLKGVYRLRDQFDQGRPTAPALWAVLLLCLWREQNPAVVF